MSGHNSPIRVYPAVKCCHYDYSCHIDVSSKPPLQSMNPIFKTVLTVFQEKLIKKQSYRILARTAVWKVNRNFCLNILYLTEKKTFILAISLELLDPVENSVQKRITTASPPVPVRDV